MELQAQGIIQVSRQGALRTARRTPQTYSSNIKLNMDPPISVAVSRSAVLFYTFYQFKRSAFLPVGQLARRYAFYTINILRGNPNELR